MSNLPVVVACQGGSPLSRMTRRVAAELLRRGLVRADEGAEHELAGQIVTLEGCPSACTTQRLSAKGRFAAMSLNLADLGIDAEALDSVAEEDVVDEIASRLAEGAPVRTTRLTRPRLHRTIRSSLRAHTPEDYLIALDRLTHPIAACGSLVANAPTLAAHVSGELGVSRPSAGEMLARLQRDGLVSRGARKELMLTPRGRAAADRALRRHRLLEVFATSFLGYAIASSFEQARRLSCAFDGDAIDRLGDALGNPERCPHGWPIDMADPQFRTEDGRLASLAALSPGAVAVVSRLAESDPELEALAGLGVVPGTNVTVCGVRASGTMNLIVGGVSVALPRHHAAAVLMLPHPPSRDRS